MLRGIALCISGIVVVVPIPESVLGAHKVIERALSAGPLIPYLLALVTSLGIMRIEYVLIGEFDRKIKPSIRQWWLDHVQAWFNGGYEMLGYIVLAVCSVNPIPVFPVSRTTSIIVWREANIVGGGWVIGAGTAARLFLVYGGLKTLFG
jgi:hypothetical protein